MKLEKVNMARLALFLLIAALSGCLHSNHTKPIDSVVNMVPLNSLANFIETGSIWQLIAIKPLKNNPKSDTPKEIYGSQITAPFTLTIHEFTKINREDYTTAQMVTASGKVGCNNWSGKAILSETTIEFGPIASTRKKCHYETAREAIIANHFINLLQHKSDYRVSQDTIHLTLQPDDHEADWVFIKQ